MSKRKASGAKEKPVSPPAAETAEDLDTKEVGVKSNGVCGTKENGSNPKESKKKVVKDSDVVVSREDRFELRYLNERRQRLLAEKQHLGELQKHVEELIGILDRESGAFFERLEKKYSVSFDNKPIHIDTGKFIKQGG